MINLAMCRVSTRRFIMSQCNRTNRKREGDWMQAIIMAAGRGSRMEHLTDDKPKAFLEVKGIKLIEYNVALLRSFQVKRIIIVTGYKSEYFEELYEKDKDIILVYNPFYEFMNVVGSFFMGQEYLDLEEDVIYMHADTLCAPEIMERMIQTRGGMVLPVEFKQCDEEAMKVRVVHDRVVEITKSIPLDQADGEFIGIAKIDRRIIPELKTSVKKVLKEKKFNYYFEGAVQDMIDSGWDDVIVIPTDGLFWGEIDFWEDYSRICRTIPYNLYKIL